MPRYISEARRTVAGHVVAQFVDDDLNRRTFALLFEHSDGETLQAVADHLASRVPMRPALLDDSGD